MEGILPSDQSLYSVYRQSAVSANFAMQLILLYHNLVIAAL